jgi:hypothetical protein
MTTPKPILPEKSVIELMCASMRHGDFTVDALQAALSTPAFQEWLRTLPASPALAGDVPEETIITLINTLKDQWPWFKEQFKTIAVPHEPFEELYFAALLLANTTPPLDVAVVKTALIQAGCVLRSYNEHAQAAVCDKALHALGEAGKKEKGNG